MLTIFSIPKPFVGHIRIIQRNAIQSWCRLRPACEIVLCGDEPGIEEIVVELGLKWISTMARNDYGTPLLSSVFSQVQQIAPHRLLCYANTDIILLSDFLKAVRRISFQKFVMAGQRWDVDLTEELDFGNPDWERQLRVNLTGHGRLHPPAGSDYFVFPKDCALREIPAFAVGRPAWDNWLIFRARQLGIPVVDATEVVTVVHQNHDYAHLRNESDKGREGPETERNRLLAGGWNHFFTLLDATHLMTSRRVLPAFGYKYLKRRWQTLPILAPGTRPIFQILEGITKPLRLRRSVSTK